MRIDITGWGKSELLGFWAVTGMKDWRVESDTRTAWLVR